VLLAFRSSVSVMGVRGYTITLSAVAFSRRDRELGAPTGVAERPVSPTPATEVLEGRVHQYHCRPLAPSLRRVLDRVRAVPKAHDVHLPLARRCTEEAVGFAIVCVGGGRAHARVADDDDLTRGHRRHLQLCPRAREELVG